MGLKAWDHTFLLACWCIELGVRLYQQHVQEHGTNDTYVLVRNGTVQNRPAQTVIDLGLLEQGAPSGSTGAPEALELRQRILAVPQAHRELPQAVQELTEVVLEHGEPESRAALDAVMEREDQARDRAMRSRELLAARRP